MLAVVLLKLHFVPGHNAYCIVLTLSSGCGTRDNKVQTKTGSKRKKCWDKQTLSSNDSTKLSRKGKFQAKNINFLLAVSSKAMGTKGQGSDKFKISALGTGDRT
jgi:hypothetical protein